MIMFELTMPDVGSWNGQWSEEKDRHIIVRSLPKEKEIELNEKSFYYNFGDGWGANIEATKIDSNKAKKMRRISKNFAGYDWMVEAIIQYGEILTSKQIKERQEEKNERKN